MQVCPPPNEADLPQVVPTQSQNFLNIPVQVQCPYITPGVLRNATQGSLGKVLKEAGHLQVAANLISWFRTTDFVQFPPVLRHYVSIC